VIKSKPKKEQNSPNSPPDGEKGRKEARRNNEQANSQHRKTDTQRGAD